MVGGNLQMTSTSKPFTIRLHIDDHLLIPFGAKKYDINSIRLSGVSTSGTYFTSPIPVAHLDVKSEKPLCFNDMDRCYPEDFIQCPDTHNDAVKLVKQYLIARCDERSQSEKKFIELYVQFVLDTTTETFWQTSKPHNDPRWFWAALLPLPQAHLYVNDPLEEGFVFTPNRMFKVDFAFWTGAELVAVEIDGGSHYYDGESGGEASSDHIIRDRMIQRAGVRTIHILNEELLRHGTKVIERLLPKPITQFWSNNSDDYPPLGPFAPF